MAKRFLNQSAFNLFTALVSFVLIILAVLLTNAMTQTEDKAIATVSDLEQQSQMQAIADLARADALQVFTYNLRLRMEGWLTNPSQENYFPLQPSLGCDPAPNDTERKKCWQKLVDNYVSVNFGGGCAIAGQPCNQQFAHELTNNMVGTLSEGGSFGRYTMKLIIDKDKMEEALKLSIQNSTSVPGKKFFEVIDCADELNCYTGTFYVNVDLSKGAFDPNNCNASDNYANCELDESIYESLPKIQVQNVATKNFLYTAILPRRNIRIYMPIRIFKAVAHAKKIADVTVFDSTIRSKLQGAGLGICDPNSCKPRTDPFGSNSGNWSDHICPRTSSGLLSGTSGERDTTLTIPQSVFSGPATYKPWEPPNTSLAVRAQVQDYLNWLFLTTNEMNDPLDTAPNTAPCPDPANIHCVKVNFTDIRVESPNGRRNTEINLPTESSTYTFCSSLQGVGLTFIYNEKNQLYRVNKNNTENYRVLITDTDFAGSGRYVPLPPLPMCYPKCATAGGGCTGGYSCETS
ncbi:MAG: hypothetical protein V1777_01750 [Candidatus Micrarchaeota archaeon]